MLNWFYWTFLYAPEKRSRFCCSNYMEESIVVFVIIWTLVTHCPGVAEGQRTDHLICVSAHFLINYLSFLEPTDFHVYGEYTWPRMNHAQYPCSRLLNVPLVVIWSVFMYIGRVDNLLYHSIHRPAMNENKCVGTLMGNINLPFHSHVEFVPIGRLTRSR